jgi:hypothetical protein
MVATLLSILAILGLALLLRLAIRSFREMLEKTTESELACRNCKSKSIHSSLPNGSSMDSLFGIFGCVPYRCDVCSFRFYARRPEISPHVSSSFESK